MHSEANGNGVEAVITNEPCAAPCPVLTAIEAKLEELRTAAASLGGGTPQHLEVAMSFLCNARGLAARGDVDLAERKLKAALNVLNGGFGE